MQFFYSFIHIFTFLSIASISLAILFFILGYTIIITMKFFNISSGVKRENIRLKINCISSFLLLCSLILFCITFIFSSFKLLIHNKKLLYFFVLLIILYILFLIILYIPSMFDDLCNWIKEDNKDDRKDKNE